LAEAEVDVADLLAASVLSESVLLSSDSDEMLEITSSILVSILDVCLKGFNAASITYILQLSQPNAKEPFDFLISDKIFYFLNSFEI